MKYLVSGGVRSGKSSYAEAIAKDLHGHVLYLATATVTDTEIEQRVAKHKQRRPGEWDTLEAQISLPEKIRLATQDILLIDCLGNYLSNILISNENDPRLEQILEREIEDLANHISKSDKTIIVVTNEVGSGVVPPYQLGRIFRDQLGWANQRVAKAVDGVAIVTMGIPQILKGDFPSVNF